MDGYEDGSFRPGSSVTAGEALKLILLAAGYPVQERTGAHWASGYLDLARLAPGSSPPTTSAPWTSP